MRTPVRRHARATRAALRAALVPTLAVLALGSPFHADASAAAGPPAVAQAGHRYTFRIEAGDDGPTRGVTHVAGDRSRIELLDSDGRPGRSYLLVTDGGRTLTSVDPEKREYSVTSADKFERIVGTALQAVDRVMTLELDDLDVTGRRLGAGGRVAGHDTQHSRLSAAFTLRVGALGFTTRQRHHVDVEYWVAPELGLPRNPLIELFAGLPTVLAQADDDFVTRMRAGREALAGQGTPLRVVITARETDDKGREQRKRTTIELGEVTRGNQDPALFRVPEGYTRRDGFNYSVKR